MAPPEDERNEEMDNDPVEVEDDPVEVEDDPEPVSAPRRSPIFEGFDLAKPDEKAKVELERRIEALPEEARNHLARQYQIPHDMILSNRQRVAQRIVGQAMQLGRVDALRKQLEGSLK